MNTLIHMTERRQRENYNHVRRLICKWTIGKVECLPSARARAVKQRSDVSKRRRIGIGICSEEIKRS